MEMTINSLLHSSCAIRNYHSYDNHVNLHATRYLQAFTDDYMEFVRRDSPSRGPLLGGRRVYGVECD